MSAFKLPPLPWPVNSFENKGLTLEQITFHYEKHHRGYVNKLNIAAATTHPEIETKTIQELIVEFPIGSPIFNLAAQTYNHSFYWKSLSPSGGGIPPEPLLKAIQEDFGSYDEFKKQFTALANAHFGSGWVWLVQEQKTETRGKLQILSLHDAGCPLTSGHVPLIGCDVWEHAYYIDYRNDRPSYMDAFWQIVNWKFASENFTA
ncbi:hypothetical protein XU18_3769 [Perkinsela sp. CCAP 1560/4]|nr:hypothetical protein XU18_3769 [Perkinsela sp. CCAP 1560/4]|eukprot:KNH05153.1 hypothetical protein XU18_3769 [Perkinsela sp. CCAP 1560/4]